MTDPIGITASVLTLANAVGFISKELYKCIQTMRMADQDANNTHSELASFNNTLVSFTRAITPSNVQGINLLRETALHEPIVEQGQELINQMEELLAKIGFVGSKKPKTNLQRRMAEFRWYLRKKEVLKLCIQFNQAKCSLMTFLSSTALLSLKDELWRLKSEIKRLQRNIERLQRDSCTSSEQRNLEVRRLMLGVSQLRTERRNIKRRMYVFSNQT